MIDVCLNMSKQKFAPKVEETSKKKFLISVWQNLDQDPF
jgi:hypothetical protein